MYWKEKLFSKRHEISRLDLAGDDQSVYPMLSMKGKLDTRWTKL